MSVVDGASATALTGTIRPGPAVTLRKPCVARIFCFSIHFLKLHQRTNWNTGSASVAGWRHTGSFEPSCYDCHSTRKKRGKTGGAIDAALPYVCFSLTQIAVGAARPRRRRVRTHGPSTVKLESATSGASREFAVRVRERLRYGLVTQEVLDRLARKGLVFYPYDVVTESVRRVATIEVPATVQNLRFAQLGVDDVHLVTNMPCRPLPTEMITERIERAQGFGVFIGEELAGYTWVRFEKVPTAKGGDTLFELDSRGAYVFDMYIARAHRGKRLAPWLRQRINEHLIQSGRDKIYSLSMVFNASTRRFKSRIGSVILERRLLVRVGKFFACDVRLKSFTTEPLPTPWVKRFRTRQRST